MRMGGKNPLSDRQRSLKPLFVDSQNLTNDEQNCIEGMVWHSSAMVDIGSGQPVPRLQGIKYKA